MSNLETVDDISLIYSQNPTLFFDDGVRKIDFILAWEQSAPSNITLQLTEKRKIFENNLKKEGLEIEHVEGPCMPGMLHFVKIHATDEVLRRYAEILKLRMPMKQVLWGYQ